MGAATITIRRGEVRAPEGEEPTVAVELADGERILDVELAPVPSSIANLDEGEIVWWWRAVVEARS